MRILHVNKFLYRRGGAESYMLDLAALQRRQGDEVAFFAMSHPDNDPSRYARHFPAHLEMNPLPPGIGGKLAGGGRMLWSTSAERGIAQVIADFRPDVAHLHNVYHQLSPSVVAALRRAGVPTVMTLHDYKLVCPSYAFLDHGRVCTACVNGGLRQAVVRRCKGGSLAASVAVAAETWLHRRFDAYGHVRVFICPSRFLAGKLAEAGVYTERLHELDHFVTVSGSPAPVSGRMVLACRLSPEKGVDTAIRAIGLIRDRAHLEIAGDGPERGLLEGLAGEVAPGAVTFHGRLPRSEVLGLIGSANALLMPSRWHENQPMTILEAFACGVPVVATDLGGIPELVTDGVTGRLVPPDDPRALADAAAALVSDPAVGRDLGRAGGELARRRFSPETHLTRLTELYSAAGAVPAGPVAASPED
jgi:glycosyltransferase involved in cell wall biosynthesis